MAEPSFLVKTNRAGAVLAVAIFALCILIFSARLLQSPAAEHWIGGILQLAILPLLYLLWAAPRAQRPMLYFVQIGLMIFFLIVELFLDYVLKIDFRNNQASVIAYVMLFFAGTGGMIGVAANAGRGWGIAAGVLFLVMAALAFVQRAVTGM